MRLPRNISSRNVVTGTLGNLLEWYDFSLYGYFAATIGRLFFASGGDSSLLKAFAVFAVGLFMRPLGGLILGHFGDRLGRKFALVLSIVIITLPTYAQIGITATALLIFLRILQGVSVGGEFIGTTIFLVEHAPSAKRGLGGSFAYMGQTGGMLGSALAAAWTSLLPEEEFLRFGWRIPFLIGIVVGGIGFFLRQRTFETPPFCKLIRSGQTSKAPLKEVFLHHWKEVLMVFFLVLFQAVSFYILLLYMVTWLSDSLGFSKTTALCLNISAMVLFTLLMPAAGRLSDRVGRKPVLLFSSGFAALLSFPLYYWIQQSAASPHPFAAALAPLLLFAVLLAAWHGPLAAVLVEVTHLKLRYSTLAVGYNFSAAIFGGTAPLVAAWMVKRLHSPLAPCFYLIAAAAIAFVALLVGYKETYKKTISN